MGHQLFIFGKAEYIFHQVEPFLDAAEARWPDIALLEIFGHLLLRYSFVKQLDDMEVKLGKLVRVLLLDKLLAIG